MNFGLYDTAHGIKTGRIGLVVIKKIEEECR